MKIAYFDCFSGAAGDMIIGSLLDAGLSFDDLKSEIDKLNLSGYELTVEKVSRNHIAGTRFNVVVSEKQPHRHPKDITKIIRDSKLDDSVKEKAIAIFDSLAQAEAKAHGEPIDKVHFHEVGAVDAIIDICGSVAGFQILGIEKIYCSPISLGTGSIETDHGLMPVPAPATAALVEGVPTKPTNVEAELTTPTGAAILTTLADFSQMGSMTIKKIGYGAGTRTLPGLPNLLRVMIGEISSDFEADSIVVMETNLDRTTPEQIGGLLDRLMASGALDAYITPISMKKNRPGHLLSVLCYIEKQKELSEIIFAGGSTLGIRYSIIPRTKLPRREVTVSLQAGSIRVKLAIFGTRELVFPEYDDISEAMKKTGKSYDEIYIEIIDVLRKEK